jgi:sugar/nucleoside kinase (ribokinase family)
LGLKTAVISELGTDSWSKIIYQDFKMEKVDVSLLIHEKKEQTGGSVILSSTNGVRIIMVHRGAASMLDPQDIQAHALQNSGWIHLSSVAGREATLQKIFTVITTSQKRFSWNPGKSEIELILQKKLKLEGINCAVFFVNLQEWQLLKPVQQQIFNFANQVIVTNSKAGGAVYQSGKKVHQYTAPVVQTVNETGAGDSFAAGVVAGLVKGLTIDRSLDLGVKNSASVVSQLGAKRGLLREADIF